MGGACSVSNSQTATPQPDQPVEVTQEKRPRNSIRDVNTSVAKDVGLEQKKRAAEGSQNQAGDSEAPTFPIRTPLARLKPKAWQKCVTSHEVNTSLI